MWFLAAFAVFVLGRIALRKMSHLLYENYNDDGEPVAYP